VFFPVRQQFQPYNLIHVRVAGDLATLMPTLRQELQTLNTAVPINATFSYEEIIRYALWGPRTGAALMSVFGAIALSLTSLGIYALMAHAVGQRTREIGIRIAVGAQSHSVVALVLRRGVLVTGVGLLAGLGAAFGLTRFVGSFLFEVKPTDPLTFAGIAALLALVALLACYVPARRATAVDPLVALRSE
jgi:putative ABC transport system permease protein